ncbi:hypothetical protein B0J17DRAFT_349465 [Rhizoctonia solani]|nr:hypothetical protein B0J17DRAFT_349465 [Rhizoctonia solani]
MVLSSISDDVGNQFAPVQSPSISSPQSPPPGFHIHQHDIRPRQPRLDVGHDLAPISLEQPEHNAIPYSPQNQQLNTRGSGFKMLEKAIRALHLGSKAIPQVQSAVEGFISCLDNFEASCRNREECEELVSELSAMADYLSRHLEDPRSQGLTKKILGIAETIDKEIEQVRKIQEKSKTTQVLRAKDHEEDLASRFRRIGNLFRRIQMEISMSEWSNIYDTLVSTYLDKLKPAMLAHYDSRISDAIGRRACTADTREETVTKIEEWCDDPTSPMIYWMNGMAGTGKTTIAYTLARKLESRAQLGASFFCTVTSKECRDAGSIVPTIAHQLSYRSTPFQAALVEVLKQHPNAATLTIPKQVERLLLDPLDAVGNNMAQNLVVIIDALDECHNSNVVGLILDSLFTSTGRLPIKFFITSPPEPGIYEKLAAQSNDLRSVLHLHEVCEDSIQRDIRRFLQEGLKLIHPSEDEIEKLTALSGRLFIFAATAVRYIVPESTPVDSRARLKIMLEVNSKSTKKTLGY